MKYKVLPRRVSILVYSDTESINYVASCQVNINGNYGTIDTLNGKDFYDFLKEYGIKPFKDLGLTEVRASVSKAHLRLIQKKLKSSVQIEVMGEYVSSEGIELTWVKLTEKEKAID